MNQELAQSKTNMPASPADLIAGLTNIKDAVSSVQTGMPILKMNGKTGIWTYGVERIAIEEGQLWAIDPYSFEHGYVCWDNAEPIGEIMRKATEPLPLEDELPDYGKRWDLQNTVVMKCMSGEETGMVCINKGSSLGHAKMVQDLTSQIIAQINTGAEAIYPIVTLDYTSYVNRKQGAEIFNPVMEIVDWKTFDDVMGDNAEMLEADESEMLEAAGQPEDSEPEPEPEKQPTRQRRRAAATPANKSRGRRRTAS